MKNSVLKKTNWWPILILLVFLIAGLVLIRDYGASADEHIQIDGGHVVWRYLCMKFHQNVPEPLKDLPDIHEFKNGYYGQAAVFPTVVLEALKGFSLDSSTVVRIRHYWNFFTYFTALCCFSVMLSHLTGEPRLAAVWLLLQILLPRIFGDIFYNDRDLMLMSWMMIFLSAFYLFMRQPGWLSSLAVAAAFAVAVNTRIFALTLLVFPFFYLLFSSRRKYLLLFVPAAVLFSLLLSPAAWDDPLHFLPEAFRHFSTQQRALDTNNEAELLFFGKLYNETNLPWYYIPMYITVTTPLPTLLSALAGFFSVVRMWTFGKLHNTQIERKLIGAGMLIILIAVPAVGILFRLTFYNGWRHFYFLYLPITWLALEGFRFIWHFRSRAIRAAEIAVLCISFILSAAWIIKAHPYQSIYLSPLFRERWIGKLDRDYWILSTTECMNYLLENVPDKPLNVVDKYAFVEYAEVGFPPRQRERFSAMYHSAQPIPYDYLFFNYSSRADNEASFDYYVPVYSVERDGIKLAEVFQRSHNMELSGADIVGSAFGLSGKDDVMRIADNDLGSSWYGSGPESLTIHFDRAVLLESFEIFPAEGSEGFRVDAVSVSSDGINWTSLAHEPKGSNGTAFPRIETSWLKLESQTENPGIREILFYGS